MIRTLIAVSLFAFAVTTFSPVFFSASDQAQAQPAADRKTQPGSAASAASPTARSAEARSDALSEQLASRPAVLFGDAYD
jgi:hypothetical protein